MRTHRIARAIAGGIAATAFVLGALATPSAHAEPGGNGQQAQVDGGSSGGKDTLRTKED